MSSGPGEGVPLQPGNEEGSWLLHAGWQMARCAIESGSGTGTGEADSQGMGRSHWLNVEQPQPVAAALRALGLWDVSSPPQSFDASAWEYRCRFRLPEIGVEGSDGHWVLVFHGLATLAHICINGQWRLTTRNMFRRYEVVLNADDADAQGCVALHLRFESLDEQLKLRKPRPRWRTPMVAHAQLRWWRTTLLGRTPGWSPPAAVVGPWKPIVLERRDSRRAHNKPQLLATVEGNWNCPTGLLRVVWDASDVSTLPPSGRIRVIGPTDAEVATAPVQATANQWLAECRIDDVALWWPHTHGRPDLHEVWLETAASHSKCLGRVGFRRVEVVLSNEEAAQGNGQASNGAVSNGGFALRVNGEPVFCRGGCWMPLDVVSLSATADAYQSALADVAAMGMNMLRLAGATVYEDDAFFDACDAQGVLVWQDLMFSNLDYPADDEAFVADVKAEVMEQMVRIGHRACLALVCGNSEVEQQAAMSGAPRELWSPALFHDLAAQWVRESAPGVPYWPSSAHGGAFPHEPRHGTTSYYGVGAYRRELGDALHSGVRFATEALAIAHIPHRSTLERLGGGVVPQVHTPLWKSRVYRDLGVGWDFDDVREHYLRHWLGVDPDALRAHDPDRHLALGRLVSAELMARTFSLWRTANAPCQGALIWYLRDLWPGAGCGVLDDGGRRKSAAHALSRVLQPVLATWLDDGLNGLVLHVRNETASALSGQGTLTLYQEGRIRKLQAQQMLSVPARGVVTRSLSEWTDGWVDSNWSYRFGPRAWDLVLWDWMAEDGRRMAQAVFVAPADLCREAGSLDWRGSAKREADGRVRVSLTSDAAAYGVHFDARGWEPSDEYFHLMPGQAHEVLFTPQSPQQHWHATAQAVNSRQVLTLLLTSAE